MDLQHLASEIDLRGSESSARVKCNEMKISSTYLVSRFMDTALIGKLSVVFDALICKPIVGERTTMLFFKVHLSYRIEQ